MTSNVWFIIYASNISRTPASPDVTPYLDNCSAHGPIIRVLRLPRLVPNPGDRRDSLE